MDKFTVKIMSYACKMADITEEGVSCKWVDMICFLLSFVFTCINKVPFSSPHSPIV
jgi:hypothetical protein